MEPVSLENTSKIQTQYKIHQISKYIHPYLYFCDQLSLLFVVIVTDGL